MLVCLEANGGPYALLNVQTFGRDTVLILDGNGGLITSDNAGETWKQQPLVFESLPNSFFFTNPLTGWICGWTGNISKTVDGGKTWTKQTTGVVENLRSLFFLDENQGWALGSDGDLLKTSNGGLKWEILKLPKGFAAVSAFFTDAKRGWLCGGDDFLKGAIYRTEDGGNTWIKATVGGGFLYSIKFLDEKQGWAVGGNFNDKASIHWTQDGGQTWHPGATESPFTLQSVSFEDGLNVWAVGSDLLLRSTDGGKTWNHEVLTQYRTFYDLEMKKENDGYGWVVGADMTIFKRTAGNEFIQMDFKSTGISAKSRIGVNATGRSKANKFGLGKKEYRIDGRTSPAMRLK